MTVLWLLRHPPVNAPKGLCYGRLDFDPVAGWQNDHSKDLAGLPRMESIVSSPASRCRVLAEHVAGSAPPIQINARWMELDFGDWEGRAFNDLPRAALDAWAASPWRFQPPGGEPIDALVQRVDDALAALAGHAGPTLIVAHAGPHIGVDNDHARSLSMALAMSSSFSAGPPRSNTAPPSRCARLGGAPLHAAVSERYALNHRPEFARATDTGFRRASCGSDSGRGLKAVGKEWPPVRRRLKVMHPGDCSKWRFTSYPRRPASTTACTAGTRNRGQPRCTV